MKYLTDISPQIFGERIFEIKGDLHFSGGHKHDFKSILCLPGVLSVCELVPCVKITCQDCADRHTKKRCRFKITKYKQEAQNDADI